MAPAKRRLLTFGINDYPGRYNDLNGCVNDVKDFREFFSFYGFDIQSYTDSNVTTVKVENKVKEAISVLRPGDLLYIHYSGHGTQVTDKSGDEGNGYDEALCLYDGAFLDDEFNKLLQEIPIGATVAVFLDCCFSATATRTMYQRKPKKNRYMRTSTRIIKKKKIKAAVDSNWITFSACGEYQTAADAYFNNRANGAFTYFLLRAFQENFTYRQWYNRLRMLLPSESFSQIPEIEGRTDLLDKLVLT